MVSCACEKVGWTLAVGFILLVCLAGTSRAAYSVDIYTVDSGGGTDSAGSFTLSGTAGQPDAGTHEQGNYRVVGGFWGAHARLSAEADLEVTMADSADPVEVGDSLTYDVSVSNLGPNDTVDVVATIDLDARTTHVASNASQGSCSYSDGTVTCGLGGIAPGSGASISVTVDVDSDGSLQATATASSEVRDPISSNDSASETTTANQPPADSVAPRFVRGPFVVDTQCEDAACSSASAYVRFAASELVTTEATATVAGARTVPGSSQRAPSSSFGVVEFAGLAPDTTYDLTVCLVDGSSNRSCAEPIPATTPAASIAASPHLIGAPYATGMEGGAATIKWETDRVASAQVLYGTSPDNLDQMAAGSMVAERHAVTLTGLSADTRYYFRVEGTSRDGVSYASPVHDFRTTDGLQNRSPRLTNVECDEWTAGEDWLMLRLVSDEPAALEMTYNGTSNPFPQDREVDDSEMLRHRWLWLDGLSPGDSYEMHMRLIDSFGNQSETRVVECDTRMTDPGGQSTPRIVAGPVADAANSGETWTLVEWQTNFLTTGVVELYDAEDGNLIRTIVEPRWNRDHRLMITGLEPGSDYSIEVTGKDPFGRDVPPLQRDIATWAEGEKPPPCYVNPGEVVYTAPGRALIRIELCQPSRTTVEYQADDGVWHSWTNERLGRVLFADLTKLPTSAVRLQTLGNVDFEVNTDEQDGDSAKGDPQPANFEIPSQSDTSPADIQNVRVIPISDQVALLRWSTSEPTSTIVRYGTSSALGQKLADSALLTDHTIRLTGLAGGDLYYRIEASDAAGNLSAVPSSGADAITLNDGPDTEGPTITSGPTVQETKQFITVSWQTNEPSDSIVEFGTSPTNLRRKIHDPNDVTSHSVRIVSLNPETEYHAQVYSIDVENNVGEKKAVTFMLPVPVLGVFGATMLLGFVSWFVTRKRRGLGPKQT